MYLPRVGPLSWLEATFEVTDTSIDGADLYTSGNFPDGYTYHDRSIGHHVGPDAIDLYFELRAHPMDDLQVWFSVDYEERGRSAPTVQAVHQFRLTAQKELGRRLRTYVFYAHDRARNTPTERRAQGHAIGVGLLWQL